MKIKNLLKEINKQFTGSTFRSFNVKPTKQVNVKAKRVKQPKPVSTKQVVKYAKKQGIDISYKEAKSIAKSSKSLTAAKKDVRKFKSRSFSEAIEAAKKAGDDKKVKRLVKARYTLKAHEEEKLALEAERRGQIQAAEKHRWNAAEYLEKRQRVSVKPASTVAAGWTSDEKDKTTMSLFIKERYADKYKELMKKGKTEFEAIEIIKDELIATGKLKPLAQKTGKNSFSDRPDWGYLDDDGDIVYNN